MYNINPWKKNTSLWIKQQLKIYLLIKVFFLMHINNSYFIFNGYFIVTKWKKFFLNAQFRLINGMNIIKVLEPLPLSDSRDYTEFGKYWLTRKNGGILLV